MSTQLPQLLKRANVSVLSLAVTVILRDNDKYMYNGESDRVARY